MRVSSSRIETSRAGHCSRWLDVGHSTHIDARCAGREAAAAAAGADDAKLLVVFSSGAYDLAELLAGIDESAPGVPLIGCSTAGEIATSGPRDSSLVVLTLGGAGFSIATTVATDASERLREAGATVAQAARQVSDCEHRVLMLLSDGLAGDQQEIVRGAYSVVGAEVPLVGGCAGDDLQMTKTFQMHDGRVLTNAVVGAAIGSDAPLGSACATAGAASASRWSPRAAPATASSSSTSSPRSTSTSTASTRRRRRAPTRPRSRASP